MNPNLTIYSMIQPVERELREAKIARGQLAADAAARHPARSSLRNLCWLAGAALVRAGTFLQHSAAGICATRPVAFEDAC